MSNLDKTMQGIAKQAERDFFRKMFADDVTADLGGFLLDAIKGSKDLMCRAALRRLVPIIWEKLGHDLIDGAVDSAIATLLDNRLIEKWEYEGEKDDSMVDYYGLPED